MQNMDSDSEDELPPGWEEKSTEDGNVYFVNTCSNKTQWTHPRTGCKKVIPKELPFGWSKTVDKEGKTLYVQKETGNKTYVDPRLAFAKEEKKHVHDFRQRFDASSTAFQRVHDTLDASLAEALAVDSGSEEEDEDELTEEQLLEFLEDPEDEGVQDSDLQPDQFHWTDNYNTFTGRREIFLQEVGPKIEGNSPLEIFCQIWDQSLVEKIVAETNKYAWQTIAQASETGISSGSRLNSWVETSVSEVYRLTAIIILMGICLLGRVDEYWSTGVLGMPGFRTIMSRDRFQILMKFLHFADNDLITDQGHDRKVAKIAPLVEYLNKKFQDVYSPRRELSIDESLLLWKGRLNWVQCIRTKAARFGIKSYELCEAVSGYVLNLVIYTGKGSTPSLPVGGFTSCTAKIVLKLFHDYLGKGYTLFMDNFYNSVDLCRYLKRRATDVVGTLNRRRQNTPASIKDIDERRTARGTMVSKHCGDISVTAWKDVKLVTTVSTYHNADTEEGHRVGQPVRKPIVVAEYNRFMGGVDLKDQKLSSYLLERKRGMKWYVKVFKRLLNITILNAYVIYCSNIGQGNKLTHRQFRYTLAEELVNKYGTTSVPRSTRGNPCSRLNKLLDHFPEHREVEGERTTAKQNKMQRGRCVRCLATNKRTMTSIFCSHCQVFICVGQCWREYHSLESI